MFTKQSGTDSFVPDPQQHNQHIRTMKGDLESPANIPFPPPASKIDLPTPPENRDAQPKAMPDPPPQASAAAPAMDSSSPFSKTYFDKEESATAASPPVPKNTAINVPMDSPLQPSSEKTTTLPQKSVPVASRHTLRKIILVFISVVVLLLLAAAGYLYWKIRSSAQPAPPSVPAQQNATPAPVQVNPLSEKYSTQNPNYFPLDADTATPESIQSSLTSTAAEIEQSGLTSPIEFVVTDSNNNPIAFHIFCALAKITMPPALLSALGDNFSLFFYSDAGTVRLSVSVDSKDKTVTALQMKAIESKATAILSPILLASSVNTQPLAFKDSSYDGFSIRYVNLDQSSPLSIDYTLNDKTLFIGTSKNTLRAILDKVSQNSPSVPAQSPATTDTGASTNSTVPAATAANTPPPANASEK